MLSFFLELLLSSCFWMLLSWVGEAVSLACPWLYFLTAAKGWGLLLPLREDDPPPSASLVVLPRRDDFKLVKLALLLASSVESPPP